ncbi:MAG: saccharopine dehydrogenase NADP-binding domain-containing protein [Flavobacteriales bacterium]|nr:saccharopine dehydrogenase NADP-binding domain-containing protein [Flavobacteriales bacterium]
MRQVLLIGSGKSTNHLIQFLLEKAEKETLFITIASLNLEEALAKIKNYSRVKAIPFDIKNQPILTEIVKASDIVISMLPAHLHIEVAKACLDHSKNLVTASYVSPQLKELHQEASKKGLLFLNEMGLDPGLDHMSSMKIINTIKNKGGKITSYQSFCGGLVAPESDTNPWNYKFTWNPRNVILAGQGPDATYLQNGKIQSIPYHKLFTHPKEFIINGVNYEGYPNRDSNQYIETYKLEGIETMIRGTLRKKGFCQAWDIFVQLGLTDDSNKLPSAVSLSPKSFIEYFVGTNSNLSLIEKIETKLNRVLSSDQKKKIEWLNWENDDSPIGLENATPAQVLEYLLKDKWQLSPNDKDMIVMNHSIEYTDKNKQKHKVTSQLEVIGENSDFTAMSKTVGLPLGIGALMVLNNQIPLNGVHTPVHECIYNPILKKLTEYNIVFKEEVVEW